MPFYDAVTPDDRALESTDRWRHLHTAYHDDARRHEEDRA